MLQFSKEVHIISVFRHTTYKGEKFLAVCNDGMYMRLSTESFAFSKIKEAAKIFIRKYRPEFIGVKFRVEKDTSENFVNFSTWLEYKPESKRVIL
jgi:hypothetical protein